MEHIYFIGCGGVGFCLLEVFKLERLYYDCDFTIIEPKQEIEDLDKIMKGRKYKHIAQPLTRENYKELLKGVNSKTFIINVSVDVDSIMLLELAKERKAWYIDTSLEQYQDFIHVPIDKITRYSQFKQNNLFHQNLKAEETMKDAKKTVVVSAGMNPGMISILAKKALVEYGKLKGKHLQKGNYAKLSYELGLKEVQCVEYDTQQLTVKATPDTFVNTWSSPVGIQEEATDLVMLSLNNDDIKEMTDAGIQLIKPTEGKDTSVRFIAERGMDLTRESETLDDDGVPFKYRGYLLPHAEIITLSEFLRYKGNSPTVMYVYRPCDEAMRSLEFLRKANYEHLPNGVVVRSKQVLSGYDSIGALLHFKDGTRYGAWTVCGIEDTRRLKLLSNPTMLQVAGFMNATIKWELQNTNRGLVQVEEMGHDFIFKDAQKYLGKIFFKQI